MASTNRPYLDQLPFKQEAGSTLKAILEFSKAARALWLSDQLFMQTFTYLLFAVGAGLFGRLLVSDGRSLFATDDLASATALVSFVAAGVFIVWALAVALPAYWKANLITQVAFLAAASSVALFFANRAPWTVMAARVLLAVAVGSLAELVASAWALRRADAEHVYRLKQLSRFLGVVAAVAVAARIVQLFR